MGRVKEWLMDEQLCSVCNATFLPMDVWTEGHEIDLGFPTCSKKCWDEYCQVANALADMTEERPQPTEENI